MLITKCIEIDMGHRVPNHFGKCRNLHGHRYKIEVGVDDKVITKRLDSSEGMVIDFSILKQVMMKEIDEVFDHGFAVSKHDDFYSTFLDFFNQGQKIIFVDFIPTAENLAKYWYDIMREALNQHSIRIAHVTVWETPTSTATYRE